jgi:anti-anti-sigma regulatory factor
MSTTHLSDPLSGASLVELSIHRLGERTCVINVGTDLRHIELPLVEEAVEGVVTRDDVRDLVFDLTFVRRYETFALVRLAREWDRLAESGCAVHVAARDARVVADLERLAGGVGWHLHPSTTRALRALLSAPVE